MALSASLTTQASLHSVPVITHRHHLCPPLRHWSFTDSQCLSSLLSEWLLTHSRFRQTPSGGVWTHSIGQVRVLLYKNTHAPLPTRVRSRSLFSLSLDSRLRLLSLSSRVCPSLELSLVELVVSPLLCLAPLSSAPLASSRSRLSRLHNHK